MLSSAEAQLLESFDLQDGDRIVTFLTRERGQVRGVAKGARRKYSRFAGQLQPLAKVKVTWFEKEGRDLVRVSGVESVRPSTRLLDELEDILLTSYLAEHVQTFVQENESAELVYRLLDSTVEALIAGTGRPPDERELRRQIATRRFEVWMLRLAGVFPELGECPGCGRDLVLGDGAVLPASADGFYCVNCASAGGAMLSGAMAAGGDARAGDDDRVAPGALAVPPGVMALLHRFGHVRLEELIAEPPPADDLALVERVASRIRRTFLQHELKSYTVMRRTLGSG